jgi:hypothetical protein
MKLIVRLHEESRSSTSSIHIDNLSGATLWNIYKKAQGVPSFLPLRCRTLKVLSRNELYKVIVIDKDVYYYYLYECRVILNSIESKVVITLAIRLDTLDKTADVTYNPDVTHMHHIVKRALLKVETYKSWV